MSEKKESTLTVPAELVRCCKGLALDFGSSTHKFVYRTKEQEQEVTSSDVKYGHLHLVSFPRREMDSALDYVRERAAVIRGVDGQETAPTIYSTGVGCTEYRKPVSANLNIKLEQLTEFDCFAKSFLYLTSRLTRNELLHPFDDEATIEPLEYIKSQAIAVQQLSATNQTQAIGVTDMSGLLQALQAAVGRPSPAALTVGGHVPLLEAEPDALPCILAMCGSGFGFMKIEKDGSFKMVDLSNRGGKSFFGLGSLLTGCETFSELMELASHGNQRNVDTFNYDILGDLTNVEATATSADDEDSLYTKSSQCAPGLIYCFGKTCGTKLADVKREDVARALLNYFVLDLVQCAQYASVEAGAKRLFFCGGFCDSSLVRRLITTEYVRRSLLRMAMSNSSTVPIEFIKPGTHLGALGCVVIDLEKQLADKQKDL